MILSQEIDKQPLFTIGIPTYNRKELLRQTVNALLEQPFQDFEIIISNDYLKETLDFDSFGINKNANVRFINQEQNLGELDNMNYLLSIARGKYFTWQFDDDPCAPSLLSIVSEKLSAFQFPKCVFTSFEIIYGTSNYHFREVKTIDIKLYSGADFLRNYLNGDIKALGCCGFYDTVYLKQVGGVTRLTNGHIALHSEYLLIIRTGLLSEVLYINAPLVSTRVHTNSWTISTKDAALFKIAGINLIKQSLPIFVKDMVKDDFRYNLSSLLHSVVSAVVVKISYKSKTEMNAELNAYYEQIREEFKNLPPILFNEAVICLRAVYKKIGQYRMKGIVKKITPLFLLKYIHILLSIVSRFSKKPF